MVRVEVPEPPVMLAVLRDAVGPEGETVAASTTVPAKLLIGATVIVEEPALPAWIVIVVGLALTVKFGVVTVTCTVAV
jgi:hypothetical protein